MSINSRPTNEANGQPRGDELLRRIGETIATAVDAGGTAGEYGETIRRVFTGIKGSGREAIGDRLQARRYRI